MTPASMLAKTIALALYKRQIEQFLDIIRRADEERGALFIAELRREIPLAGTLLDAALEQTPEETIRTLASYMPELAEMPEAREVIARIQARLRGHAPLPAPRRIAGKS